MTLYYCISIYHRSTPVECLHTILLGPFKYLFGELMERLTPDQKRKVAARINSFPTSGFTTKLSGSITKYYKSALGRDFKLLAQVSLFAIWDHLDDQEQSMWLSLCKVSDMVQVLPHKLSTLTMIMHTSRCFS